MTIDQIKERQVCQGPNAILELVTKKDPSLDMVHNRLNPPDIDHYPGDCMGIDHNYDDHQDIDYNSIHFQDVDESQEVGARLLQ